VQGRRRDDDGPIRVGFTVSRKNGTATSATHPAAGFANW